MTLDTNIIIAYIAGEDAVVNTILGYKRGGEILIVPTVVETEVLAFSGWTGNQYAEVVQMLTESFTSVSFDRAIAHIAADIRRATKLKFPDAAIAATALFTNTPVLTRNVRDFERVPGLDVVSV